MFNQLEYVSNGRSLKIADVHFVAAMNAGVVTGYNRRGSIISRIFVFTAIALNSVPTEIKPMLPKKRMGRRAPMRDSKSTFRKRVNSGRDMSSTKIMNNRLLRNFPK